MSDEEKSARNAGLASRWMTEKDKGWSRMWHVLHERRSADRGWQYMGTDAAHVFRLREGDPRYERIAIASDDFDPVGSADSSCAAAPLTHVALRFDGKVWSLPRPYRHHHIIRLIRYLDSGVDSVDCDRDDQGFLDESGRYLTREQAQVSAFANGQVKAGRIIGGVLTSEDLW